MLKLIKLPVLDGFLLQTWIQIYVFPYCFILNTVTRIAGGGVSSHFATVGNVSLTCGCPSQVIHHKLTTSPNIDDLGLWEENGNLHGLKLKLNSIYLRKTLVVTDII